MKEALDKFVDHWKNKEEIVGILLSGSYAVGLEKKNSDVDIRLVLDSNQTRGMKGLQEIDGFSFSYLGHTKNTTTKSFNLNFFINSKFEARIFHIGQILYEENGLIQEIKKLAKYYYELPFIKKEIPEDMLKGLMYVLYSEYNYLMETAIDSPFFIYNYVIFMKMALEYYASILNIEMVIDTKLENVLINEGYINKYNFGVFPDKEFKKMWIKNLSKDQINKKNLYQTYHYLKNKIYPLNEEDFYLFL